MEYAAGGDMLFHIQVGSNKFSEADKKTWSAQILLALYFLHLQGVIYRDLKLDNVLLDAHGNIKLADYGLAKDGLNLADGTATTFCGTPEFMAPEIFKGKRYTRAVDWWSYGVFLYELFLEKVLSIFTFDRRHSRETRKRKFKLTWSSAKWTIQSG